MMLDCHVNQEVVIIPMWEFVDLCRDRLRHFWGINTLDDKRKDGLMDEFLEYTEAVWLGSEVSLLGWVDNWVHNARFYSRDEEAEHGQFDKESGLAWEQWCEDNDMTRWNEDYAFQY